MSGGYDAGYKICRCFWGKEPGSFVNLLAGSIGDFRGLLVLDAGCGEGKNAVYLRSLGADVHAVDISEQAIANGRKLWKSSVQPDWSIADVRQWELRAEQYDVIIAYGLFHCLASEQEIRTMIASFMEATMPGGYNVICSLNGRITSFGDAHPDLHPCMLSHSFYVGCYSSWEIIKQSDSDLFESHSHDQIAHTHSLTRILSRKTPCQ